MGRWVHVRIAADLEALQRRWRSLVATVEQERFPELLRYHLLCELPQVRSQRLFKLVRDRTTSTSDVFMLLDELERRAELFVAVADPNHGYWVELPDAKAYIRELNLFRVENAARRAGAARRAFVLLGGAYIRELNLFRVRQMMPLLFAAWESFSRENFVRVLRLVSVVSFRYTVVSSLNPSALEAAFHYAAKAVKDGTATTPAGVFERLKPIYVADEKTRQDFAGLVVGTGGRQRKLAKYLLARLEQDAAGRACDPDTDPGTIEHVLPENPTDEWEHTFASALWESSGYRLGNLTLLESAVNRSIGNAVYPDKLNAYRGSKYALSRAIPAIAPEQWTPELLDERQGRLAARAVHLWRADFA